MNKKKTYRIISLSLIVISIIGFIATTENKSSHIILEKRGSSKSFEFDIKMASNMDYIFTFWVIDEEGGYQWANVSAYAEVILKDTILYSEVIEFAESDESTGIKRAQEGFNYNYHSIKQEVAKFKGTLAKGDQWQVEVYENMTELDNMKPGLFIIVFIVSLFFFLKARNMKA